MHSILKTVKILIVISCGVLVVGCATTGNQNAGPDDLGQWMQNEMSRRGVLSSSHSTSTLRGV